MTAICITHAGGPEVLQAAVRPLPQPKAGEVLIKVAFAVVTGSQLRASALALKTEIARQVMDRVWPHLGTKVTPIIDSVVPLARACDAHARMESSVHIGKILLEIAH